MFDFNYTSGGISPIEATPDMTQPVGQRDGQLYTEPGSGLPDPSTLDNYSILEVYGAPLQPKNWRATTRYKENYETLEQSYMDLADDFEELENSLSALNERITALQEALSGVAVEEGSSLEELTASLGATRTRLRTALNEFLHTGIPTNARFGGGTESEYVIAIQDFIDEVDELLRTDVFVDGEAHRPYTDALEALRNIRLELKDAINEKYSNPPIQNDTPFEDYKDYIPEVDDNISTSGATRSAYPDELGIADIYPEVFTVPTEASDGTAYHTELSASSTSSGICRGVGERLQAKTLIVPAYYKNIGSSRDSGAISSKPILHRQNLPDIIEEIQVQALDAQNTFIARFCNWVEDLTTLHKVTLGARGNTDATLHNVSGSLILKGGSTLDGVVINLPAFTGCMSTAAPWEVDSTYTSSINFITTSPDGTLRPITLNAPYMLSFGCSEPAGTNNPMAMFDVTGEITLPSAKVWTSWTGNNGEITLKLPAVTNIYKGTTKTGNWASTSETVTAPLNIYIGPDLAKMDATVVSYILANSNITIHIPQGESTTKDTLDEKNITYTQDYIIN